MTSDHKEDVHFKFSEKHTRVAVFFIIAGLIGLAVSFFYDPEHAWVNILVNGYYFTSLALMGVFFTALANLAGARWSDAIRRIPEAVACFLPIGAVMMLVVLLGLPALYHWSHADAVLHDHLLKEKSAWLNPMGFAVRMIVVLAVWIFFASRLRSNSIAEDVDGNPGHRRRNVVWSALFMVFFAYSFSMATFDWIMSLEPHWYSTIFAVYGFSGAFVNGIAVISLLVIILKESGYLQGINENHFHDLGKLLFAFTMFWAYIWYSQFMLIWYGNIPEETVYYVNRIKNDWDWLFALNFFMNFIVPFFILLPRNAKRNMAVIKRVSVLLLVGHWLDIYLMTAPGVSEATVDIGIQDVAIALGYAGVFMLIVGKALTRANLMPLKSPFLADSLHHHQ